jgi:hypothetical protein
MNRGLEVHEAIADCAARITAERRAEVERLFLEGAAVVQLPYLPDVGRPNPRWERYEAPSWRREPRARLKLAIARWRHRHS